MQQREGVRKGGRGERERERERERGLAYKCSCSVFHSLFVRLSYDENFSHPLHCSVGWFDACLLIISPIGLCVP